MAEQREKVCAMHYMGTGLGLTASLHCLAAINGNGPIELDANPNPLRTELGELDLTIRNGHLKVPSGCGHGSIEQAHKIDEFIKLEEINKCLSFLNGVKNKSVYK